MRNLKTRNKQMLQCPKIVAKVNNKPSRGDLLTSQNIIFCQSRLFSNFRDITFEIHKYFSEKNKYSKYAKKKRRAPKFSYASLSYLISNLYKTD